VSTKGLLLRRGLLLEYLTLGWNVAGSAIVIAAAVVAHSVALAGFGLDSLIEIVASVVVVWQLTGAGRDREKRALRIIGVAFVALALYILVESALTLMSPSHPTPSPLGIAWLAATVVIMFSLSFAKGRVGHELSNAVLVTESKVTLIDGYLAVAVLAGLVLNAMAGWWWADPLAGLVIVYYGFVEGTRALQESRGAA
jgi:divalent metal cation (Fe/Co/Zn/Cd) transporter